VVAEFEKANLVKVDEGEIYFNRFF
jgi:hypothetical protein